MSGPGLGSVATMLVLGAIFAGGARATEPPPGILPGFVPPPSVHQREWLAHRGQKLPEPEKTAPSGTLETPLRPASPSTLTRTVYGFLPYWVVSDLSHLHWSLLSHVAYFSVDLNSDGSLTNQSGSYAWPSGSYVSALRSTAHSNGVKVTLTATNFSASSITTLLSSAANRQSAIANLVALVQGTGDGVSIDFEGVPVSQKANLVTFMTALTAAIHSAVPGSHVSVCTPAVDWSGAFDYDQLAMSCDGLFIMGYDYYYSGSGTAGPCAPLTGGGVWGTYNVTWTINDYFTWGGSANRSKFILGVPYYGNEWPTTSTSVPSSTTASGSSKTYNVARSSAATYGRLWDSAGQTPYYVYSSGGAHQGWYDDAESLGYKWDLVNSDDLGGTGIWALNYDTADNLLWNQLQAKFGCTAPATPTASNSGPICAGATLSLSTPAVTGAAYSWTGPNGFSSTARTPSIAGATTAVSGTYSVTVTVGGCTSAAGTTAATVNADSAAPAVTAPGSITVDQTVCCGAFGGATPGANAVLATFVAGGTATDDCDPSPARLAAQAGGVDVTSSTCLEAGTTTVTFRFRDTSGKTGTAGSTVTVRMFGDLNLDRTVDPSDMVVFRAYFNFAASPGTPPFAATLGMADLSHDTVVDPSDLVLLRAYFNLVVACLAP